MLKINERLNCSNPHFQCWDARTAAVQISNGRKIFGWEAAELLGLTVEMVRLVIIKDQVAFDALDTELKRDG